MGATDTSTTPRRLWLCMADSPRMRNLSRALAEGMGVTVYLGPTIVPDGPIAVMLADDANAARVQTARQHAAPHQKVVLVTGGASQAVAADLRLPHDIDTGSLGTAIEGLFAFREHELSPGSALGAAKTLQNAAFSVQTLGQARQLAGFLGSAMPRACERAVGLYVLLANAIELGNLGFSVAEKAQGLATGTWDRKLAKRLSEPSYASRRAQVEFQRGERMISILIQDDGDGITTGPEGQGDTLRSDYRARSTQVLKALGFAELTWLGGGSTLSASIVLEPAGKPAAARAPAAS
ncbi:hypothetical protein [Maricaulis sp.]|uniref:hypothetical protein n=1 Tax=Maricaulis sp. TaxID=1486257 RepID=UPI003A8CE03A